LCSIFAISGVSKSISPILIANEKNAEEEILHEIENQPRTSTQRLANLSLRIQNAAQVLKLLIANDGKHFEQLL
jgi:hypothetical protein